MSFRTKLLLIVSITILASVSVVAYGVTYYTRAAFEELDTQRTEALVAQFNKEFTQRGKEIARQVKNIAEANITERMALDLARPNADQSLYVSDANGAAQDHELDFVEFVNYDGTLISSVQYPARVGYKNDWVTASKDWNDSQAFLRKEELPDGVSLSLSVVRTNSVGDKSLYIIGGRRLDQWLRVDICRQARLFFGHRVHAPVAAVPLAKPEAHVPPCVASLAPASPATFRRRRCHGGIIRTRPADCTPFATALIRFRMHSSRDKPRCLGV